MKTKTYIQSTIIVLLLALAFLPILTVSAQKPTPSDDDVNAIAKQLFCPVCENTPLDVCPTQACHDWRELIRQMLAAGKSTDEIKQYFVDHYGARVLSEPPQTGLNWLVYVVPPVAFLAGVFLLYKAFRSWRRFPKESTAEVVAGPEPPEKNDDYASRVEAELRKRE